MKKILSLLLILALVLARVPFSVAEDEPEKFKSGDYQYVVLEDGTVEIVKHFGSEAILDIPSELDGKKVSGIGEYAFSRRSLLTNVTIPDSVTSIGNSAFYGCSWMTGVTIPDSVTSIGKCAFPGCSGLTNVTIPDSVTSIGVEAFIECTGLTDVTIPDSVTSIGKAVFAKCSDTLTITVGRDSYAKQYCIDNGLAYTYVDANDWLNS